jgi:polyisoprenoid-binding protein YceI
MRLAALLLLPLALPVVAGDWNPDPQPDSLRFEGRQQGEAFHGRFGRFEARIRFDPEALETARFEVTVELASADTRSGERDEVLHGSDFFFVRRFPQASFVAEDFEALGEGRFRADAELTIRDRTVAIDFPFEWRVEGNGARILAEVVLDRLAFGLGDSEDWRDPDTVGHQVTVRVDLPLGRD